MYVDRKLLDFPFKFKRIFLYHTDKITNQVHKAESYST